jgi:hypothetical protein
MKEILARFGRWLDRNAAQAEEPEEVVDMMTLDGLVFGTGVVADDDEEDNTTL